MTSPRDIRINVPVLARVEGEGALNLHIKGAAIERLDLRIFEPPRLFEKLLEGRSYEQVPDMVARICGICPVAYQMSAVHALEQIFGPVQDPWVRAVRRLFYCGEWLQSHSLHIHLLAAPDFLGFDSAPAMAAQYPDEVRRGLRLQALGNDIMRLIGGRSVHPVGACVGGFHHQPDTAALQELKARLVAALVDASELVRWCAALVLPDDDQAFCSVALRHADEYPMNAGRIISSAGLDIDIADYTAHFHEHQVPHSTALHSLLDGKPYLVGPLARINLNLDRLPGAVQSVLEETGIRFPSRNMFHSMVARAAEIHYALLEAVRLIDTLPSAAQAAVAVQPRAGTGFGCTEAPRGLLWHRYETDADGRIVTARIVPPTSQNQVRMEEDIRLSLERFGLQRSEAELRARAEKVIRNYDPCISCATHFLKLKLERTPQPAGQPAVAASPGAPPGHDPTPVRIIGIGSPYGRDRVGWEALEALDTSGFAARFRPGLVRLQNCAAPAALPALLDGVGLLVLIDALPDHAAARGWRRIERDELDTVTAAHSSHTLGLAETVAVCESLAVVAPRIVCFGISTGPDTDGNVDEVARRIVAALGDAIRAEIEAWLTE
jgi:coenzyme F420-reducing hydrogenase alpha subunit